MTHSIFTSQHNKGFTLVELSIVLVIIGLIVSGIVGGRSLIESTKLQKIIMEFRNYETAVRAFELQYDYKPGDLPNANSYWPDWTDGRSWRFYDGNGNGDHVIGGQEISGGRAESNLAWRHMELAGILTGIKWNYIEGSTYYNGEWPTTKAFDDTTTGYYYGVIGTGDWVRTGYATGKYVFLLGRTTASTSFGSPGANGALNTRQAKAIDTKIDDGAPGTGRILGRTRRSGPNPGCVNQAWSSTNLPTAWTNLDISTRGCDLIYMLDD